MIQHRSIIVLVLFCAVSLLSANEELSKLSNTYGFLDNREWSPIHVKVGAKDPCVPAYMQLKKDGDAHYLVLGEFKGTGCSKVKDFYPTHSFTVELNSHMTFEELRKEYRDKVIGYNGVTVKISLNKPLGYSNHQGKQHIAFGGSVRFLDTKGGYTPYGSFFFRTPYPV